MVVLHSLVLEVLHHILHVLQLSLQLHLLVAEPIQLSAEVGNVGLKHCINVGAGGGLVLQEAPFGLQHFVLLLQEADLNKCSTSLETLFSILALMFYQ